jgi:hypothetical protein
LCFLCGPREHGGNAGVCSSVKPRTGGETRFRAPQKRRRGRHPRGCRPRSGACVTFFLSPGLPLPEPRIARPGVVRKGRPLDHQGFARFGGCHLFPRGQASFAIRITQIWWLSPYSLSPYSHVGQPAVTPKTPPRTAPSWMPPAVRRLRHVLPVTGSSAPGAPLSRGQASFAIRTTQIWWLSPFSQDYPDLVAVTFFTGLPRFGGCHLFRCHLFRGGCHLIHTDSISLRSRRRPPRRSGGASAAAKCPGQLRRQPPIPSAWVRGRPRFG